MRTPAPAATSAAAVDTLNVPRSSPPVPQVSSRGPSTSTRRACCRITLAIPVISSTVSPFSRRAIRNAAHLRWRRLAGEDLAHGGGSLVPGEVAAFVDQRVQGHADAHEIRFILTTPESSVAGPCPRWSVSTQGETARLHGKPRCRTPMITPLSDSAVISSSSSGKSSFWIERE